jgi:hypothetical protein
VTFREEDGPGDVGSASFEVTVAAPTPRHSIAGCVYADVNNNGRRDPAEIGLPNVPVTLTGSVQRTVLTGPDGRYLFTELPSGTYDIRALQPHAFLDGIDTPGGPSPCRVENDAFLDIELNETWPHATEYFFGERGLRPHLISLRLLLASSLPPTQLVGQLTLGNGEAWVAFTADSHATLTLTAESEPNEAVVLEVYDSSFLPIMLGRSTSLDLAVVQNQSYVIYVSGTESVAARLTLDQSGTYTNALMPLDVNADGMVSPLDALLIINRLNASGARFMSGPNSAAPYCDTNADLMITPVDALLVINHLNEGIGDAEGEESQLANDNAAGAPWSLGFAPPVIHVAANLQTDRQSVCSDHGWTFRANAADDIASVVPPWVGCAHDADADDLYEAIALELMRRNNSSRSNAQPAEEAVDLLLLTGQWEE